MLTLTSVRRGYTLLEVLVSTGIFMIVMVVAIGIFTLTISGSSTTEQMRLNSQSARFAFESINREIKLAKGLVFVSGSAGGNAQIDQPYMVIPPFEVTPGTADQSAIITVYQVKKSEPPTGAVNGEQYYTVSRRQYFARREARNELVVTTQNAYDGQPQTASRIYSDVNQPIPGLLKAIGTGGLAWGPANPSPNSILPTDFVAEQFAVNFSPYPPSPGKLEDLIAQPFVQIDLTVLNWRYNANKSDEKQVRTTFRTMIVPRDFSSPFEVVQPGLQGGG